MDLRRIADKAKELVDKRGGTDSLKEDAAELKDIATGSGSVADKAKEAVEAVKDPGAGGRDETADPPRVDAPGPAAEGGEGRQRRGGRGGRRKRGAGPGGRGRRGRDGN
jgi:hypothetical protein